MYYVEISSDFSAAHFLESEFMHGHNFKIKARFYCAKDEGHQIDLNKAKDALDEICAQIDHKIILPGSFADIKNISEIKVQEKLYKIPDKDIIFLPITATTAEYVAEYIAKNLKEKFKDKNLKIYVELEEDYDSSASFFD